MKETAVLDDVLEEMDFPLGENDRNRHKVAHAGLVAYLERNSGGRPILYGHPVQ